jgi:formamidopyrimidine-DNA glycosylase
VPELPDIVVYIEALESRILNHTLESIRIASPFILRSVDPPPGALVGKKVRSLRRLGKQIVIGFADD